MNLTLDVNTNNKTLYNTNSISAYNILYNTPHKLTN